VGWRTVYVAAVCTDETNVGDMDHLTAVDREEDC
jgi:hypothetical protein